MKVAEPFQRIRVAHLLVTAALAALIVLDFQPLAEIALPTLDRFAFEEVGQPPAITENSTAPHDGQNISRMSPRQEERVIPSHLEGKCLVVTEPRMLNRLGELLVNSQEKEPLHDAKPEGEDQKSSQPSTEYFYVVLDNHRECNIFHQLWLIAPTFRSAMEMVVLPAIRYRQQGRKVEIVVGVARECEWITTLIEGYSMSQQNISVSTSLVSKEGWSQWMNEQTHVRLNNCVAPRIVYHRENIHAIFPTQKNWSTTAYHIDHHLVEWVQRAKHNANLTDILLCSCRDGWHSPPRSILWITRKPGPRAREPMDMETGKPAFSVVHPQLTELGFNVSRIDMEGLKGLEQARAVSQAHIIVGAHGAALTNALWMPSPASSCISPVLIEITARFAWCQRATKREAGKQYRQKALLEANTICRDESEGYFQKADYFALANILGYVRYVEVVNVGGLGTHAGGPNPIHTDAFWINATDLMDHFRKIRDDPSYDFKVQRTYNGIEGVQPYTYE